MESLTSGVLLKILEHSLGGNEDPISFGFIYQLSSTSTHFKSLFEENDVWAWLANHLGFDPNETQHLPSKSLKEFCCDVIRWHKNPTEIGAQNLSLTEGIGRITLEGRNGKALKLDGRTILFDFSDCAGSMGRYFLYEGSRNDGNALEELKRLRHKINNSFIHPMLPLSLQFKSFLKLFQAGLFRIRIQHNIILSPSGDHYERHHNQKTYIQAYYPSGTVKKYGTEVLHFSQTPAITNPERVEFYVKQIQQGLRPLLIILTHGPYKSYDINQISYSNCVSFLLDGHHKLCAYCKAKVLPSALRIQNLDVIERDQVFEYVKNVDSRTKRNYLAIGEHGSVWWKDSEVSPFRDDAPGPPLPLLIEKGLFTPDSVEKHFDLSPFNIK
eukprot:TRINITY_DN8443_c0_g1_i2.p1 TRINITY_DN8443_c0_g1~~TRINITY_DN8443_c0_g1_i2.p1  ORF type:complete len:384 (+),score=84.69 TRINITY_DN8443_c0_g1_i2:266-1417(+)